MTPKLRRTRHSAGFNRISGRPHLVLTSHIWRIDKKVSICWQKSVIRQLPLSRLITAPFSAKVSPPINLQKVTGANSIMLYTAGQCRWVTGGLASVLWLTSCEQRSSWTPLSVWPGGLSDTFRKRTLSLWDYLHKDGRLTHFICILKS